MKEKILNTAIRLMSINGLKDVSYAEISQEVGVSKSLVFKYLKNRDNAEISCLKFSISTFNNYINDKIEGLEGLERLRTFFSHWLNWTEGTYLPGGCPMLIAIFELNGRSRSDKVRKFLIQHHQNFIKNLERDLEKLDTKEVRGFSELAFSIVGLYTSHHIYKHHLGNKKSFNLAMKNFDLLFNENLSTV